MKNLKFLTVTAAAAISLTAFADYHHNFEKNSGGWVTYNYWGGKTTRSNEAARSGKYSLKMVATEKRKQLYALAILPIRDSQLAGLSIRLTFYAKGTGAIKAGMLCYTRNKKGGENMKFEYSQPVTLNDQWQKIEYIADFADRPIEKVAPAIRIDGACNVYIDDSEVVFSKTAGIKMTALDKHQIVREGSPLPKINFNFSVEDETVNFFAFPENRKQPVVQSSVISEEGGKAVFQNDTAFTPGAVNLIAAGKGVNAIHYSYVVPQAEYDRLDAFAKQIKLKKPLHILFLGDSLTDRNRDANHADKLVWWLNKYNPGKVSRHNLAISGDMITRIDKRLDVRMTKKGRPQWRQYMYNYLFNRPYDLIIISLGHNDCASFKSSNYKKPQVDLKEAEAAYKRVIAKLRSKSKAPIVLLTPVANNLEQSKKQGALSVRYGGPGVVFGLPEFVNPFNAMVKKVAAETNCSFIDVYTPMLGKPELPTWFLSDGVHFTPAGHQKLSGLILEALAKEGSPLR